jgi:hypothetical protein
LRNATPCFIAADVSLSLSLSLTGAETTRATRSTARPPPRRTPERPIPARLALYDGSLFHTHAHGHLKFVPRHVTRNVK